MKTQLLPLMVNTSLINQEYSKQNKRGRLPPSWFSTTARIQRPMVIPPGFTRTLFRANPLSIRFVYLFVLVGKEDKGKSVWCIVKVSTL